MSLFRDSSFYVVGLARTGRVAIDFLLSMNAEVIAWDDDETTFRDLPEDVSIISPSAAFGSGIYDRLNGLLLSPGIGDEHDAAEYANRTGVPLISDISLFASACPDIHHIALTGTNGKSTVCLLIEHVLQACGVDAIAAGNIGVPILRQENIAKVRDNPLFVLELSSYQIDRLHSPVGFAADLMGPKQFTCDVAILLNIAEDHLERYGGEMSLYTASKERLFKHLKKDGLAVVGIDDDYSLAIYERLEASHKRVLAISGVQSPKGGIGVRDGKLWDSISGEEVLDLSSLPHLSGAHNIQNLAAAYACLREYNLDKGKMLSAFRSFRGLAHRQEFIGEAGKVRFINDSKATNSAAVLPAFRAFENIFWLAGGILKEDDLSALVNNLENIRGGYFFGQDGRVLSDIFKDNISCEVFSYLDEALAAAYASACKNGGGVILLSPCGSSFDQYLDFNERGESFRELVEDLLKA